MSQRILVVDDEADVRRILRLRLKDAGYRIDTALKQPWMDAATSRRDDYILKPYDAEDLLRRIRGKLSTPASV